MTVGYSGKLPAFGDFVEGGAALGARRSIADWAESALARLRPAHDEAFRATFLTAPLWRFAVGAGVFGDRAVMGVLSPSMDKVGRLFPFAIVGELEANPEPVSAMTRHHAWLEDLEGLVLDMLAPDASLDMLAGLTPPEPFGALNGTRAQIRALAHPSRMQPAQLDETGLPILASSDALDLGGGGGEEEPDGLWISADADGLTAGLCQFGPATPELFGALVVQEAG